jgi:hypothetical protein
MAGVRIRKRCMIRHVPAMDAGREVSSHRFFIIVIFEPVFGSWALYTTLQLNEEPLSQD